MRLCTCALDCARCTRISGDHEGPKMRPKLRNLIWIAPLVLTGILLFIAIGGTIVMLLWNWILPPLTGWREITFWQAIGLLALCRILFGGHGWRGHGHPGLRRRLKKRIAERIEERCAGMTPEERERFRQRVGERWGSDPPAPGNQA